jgi:RNA polymerase primary sigma factor
MRAPRRRIRYRDNISAGWRPDRDKDERMKQTVAQRRRAGVAVPSQHRMGIAHARGKAPDTQTGPQCSAVAEPPTGQAVLSPPVAGGSRSARPTTAVASSLDLYLRDIGHAPRLNPDQEVALARRSAQGDVAAAAALAQANLRLVVSVARRYTGYGAIATQRHTIRLPLHVGEALARRSRARDRLAGDLGREPSPEEAAMLVAEESLLSAARAAAQEPLSLEMAVGEGGAAHLGDMLRDEALPPEEQALHRVHAQETQQVLSEVLTERERVVLALHYGLEQGAPETLDAVGRRLGITCERARQIEARALAQEETSCDGTLSWSTDGRAPTSGCSSSWPLALASCLASCGAHSTSSRSSRYLRALPRGE